ncbi:hypothetical protein AOQ84DRAFT_111508 [Glonium stellatum]|uniref:J domain-containing protein n=1 Tax=Glonium stellatum TaxID=574774 RepID=A0A8E2ETR4_9PEZI|nr:hypothetical protein AOQ84DRAFT_111508 [Glonium stellatum]
MVKADPKRDYYADLELPQTADTEEIRKQFRKLALKYHPDRNPGREDDFVSKFQAIQAAHEILGDPEQRAKYDNERRKHQAYYVPTYRRPPPPPRNAYSTTATNYPPTPQRATRPPPRTQYSSTASTAPNTAPNGASRFTNFPKPPPTAQRPNMRDDAEDRANFFNAWQRMNHKSKTPPNGEEAFTDGNKWANPPSASKPSMSRNSTTRGPRKAGFDPATPGDDEPAAHGGAYYNTSRYRTAPPEPPPPPSPPQAYNTVPPSPRPDPLRHFKAQMEGDPEVPFMEGRPRTRTPYSSASGERTTLAAGGLGRSASTRNTPSRPSSTENGELNSDSGRTRSRHRSASPNLRKPFVSQSPARDGASTARARPKMGGNATHPFAALYESSSDDSGKDYIRRRPKPATTPVQNRRPRSPQVEARANPPNSAPHPPMGQRSPNIFNVPTPEDSSKANFAGFKSRSAESINTKFSPNDWSGKFEGTPDYFAPAPPTGKTAKGRQSPTRGRPTSRPRATTQQSSQQSSQTFPPPPPGRPNFMAPPQSPRMPPPPQQSSQMPPPPQHSSQIPPVPSPQPLNVQTEAVPGPQPVKFPREEWQKTFRESNWVYPTKGPSPTRPASVSTKRTKGATARKPSATPKQASVSDAADEPSLSNGKFQASAESLSSESQDSSAMDIDTDLPPAPNGRAKGPASTREARTASSSPQKAEWKDDSQKQSDTAPSSATDPFGPGLESLFELKNVEPIKQSSNGGLRDLNNLSSTLPFESRTSASHPFKPSAPQNLNLPLVPKPPDEPSRLTKQTFARYMHAMQAYMVMWHGFNSTLVSHFAEREKWCACLDAKWLTSLGEPTNKPGFDSYLRSLQEDEKVRTHWNIACEKHRTAVEACARVREKGLRGLPEV